MSGQAQAPATARILDLMRAVFAEGAPPAGSPDLPEAARPAGAAAAPESESLKKLKEEIGSFDPCLIQTRGERLTFWINIYNVIALGGTTACELGGSRYSLADIEYGILRNNARRLFRPWRYFRIWDRRRRLAPRPADPRAVFALARPGSPDRPRFFEPDGVEGQLDDATAEFLNNGGVVIDRDAQSIRLAPLLRECAADFGGGQGVMRFIAAHLEPSEDTAFLYAKTGRVDIIFEK